MTFAIAVFGAGLSLRLSRRDQGVFLSSFLGLYAFIKLDELFLVIEGYAYFPHLLGMVFPLKLLLGPTIYFYTRSLVSPGAIWLTRKDWPALIAPTAALLVALPYYILSSEQKIALMSPETRDPEIYAAALLGCKIGFGLFLISSLAYLYASQRLFQTHERKLRDLFSRIDDKTVDWLRWIILILAVGWSGYAVSEVWAIQGGRPVSVLFVFQSFELVWIGAIAFFGVAQRPVAVAITAPSSSTFRRSSLDENRMAAIARKLDHAMAQHRLFERPSLSLRDVSDAVDVSENHLSETFSKHFGINFFDYVNGHRILHACILLENDGTSVLEAALECGFNSRSTFNAAFKKHVGATPTQFRKGLRPSQPDIGAPDRSVLAD